MTSIAPRRLRIVPTGGGAVPIDAAAVTTLFADLAAGGDQPLLDRKWLAELQDVLGPGRIAQLLALFADELADRPGAIRLAIGRSDFPAATAQAHSFKGAARSIGARAVGEAAARLEQGLGTPAARQAERLRDALRDLDRAVSATLALLPRPCATAPSPAPEPRARTPLPR